MAKPTKTACAREGEIERKPFTGDLTQQILAGFSAYPGGILGFLDKVGLETPRLAGRARRYAKYFATQGGVLQDAKPGKNE